VTGPALGNSAQATSGCPQHPFCSISLQPFGPRAAELD
jgi:hypothetical protein